MGSARRPFFTADEDDDDDDHGGVASLESMEAGFSGSSSSGSGSGAALSQSHSLDHHNPFSSRPAMARVGGSLRNIPYMGCPVSSPRSARFFYEDHHRPHFLDSCALCKKPLGNHRDIFMYRGDTAFCSEECRQEQMEMDEAREKNLNLSSSLRKDQRKSSTSPSKSQGCHVRTGTVAAA
ncbi:FCS-Like Zinc finger 2 [Punica granatum]|uniref:FLZ-type domain-containing protein n=2 Tax=Punica granatum TaxID=22663 RepID=A0A218XTP4_PUNGR|nr:FCS-Like Zinc finger 2 [Punica granatum]OWM88314.1 hypothetical protein CDL15_Pgr003726 [Punica granatum]PKI46929.1 hypothetical protein CRG98_032740 [Punica granatum]